MTPKERLLNAISGKETDRIPWSPFLAYWWESQPKQFQAKGQLQFLEDIGADPLLRGFHELFKKTSKNCCTTDTTEGKTRLVTHTTPVGELRCVYTYSPQGDTWYLMEHPVKTVDDLKTLIYINENMVITPAMDKFLSDYRDIGNRGLYVPLIGSEGKTSFQSLIEYWVGTEELVYMLADFPEAVEECLSVMSENSIKTAEISVESPAEAFIFWEDSSTTNIDRKSVV